MKNLKKVLAMVLAFACTFTMFAGAKVFEDVPAGSDYSEAITMLSDLGIIQGKDDGKYHPEDTITRAEACAMIARMMTGDPNVSQYVGAQNFTDVAKGSWKDSAIGYCYINNIVIGVGNNKFEPDRAITDAEFITMVVRAMGYETPDMAQGYPYTYMSNAQAIGLLDGVNMVANTDALRGEDAQVIYNALFADYARGAKLVNTTHGTSVETYPTLAESVWGLERAAVGTWDKDDKDDETAELTNCKAHTWVVIGIDPTEEGRILAYPIDDDTTELYTDNDNKLVYSFKYAGDVESIKGYQVELWGEGSHGEPTWENKNDKYVWSDNWEIKAVKTVKGQTEYDYNASMADSDNDDGTIDLDETSLDLESVAANAKDAKNNYATFSDVTTYLSGETYNDVTPTTDKKVEQALNARDGAQYKLMDWDSDGDVDWVVVDEANYYKVESVNSKRLTLSAMKAGEDAEDSTKSETMTWKLDGLNDEDDYKVQVEAPDDLEEGDIIEVTYSNVYDKGEKSEVVTATVTRVDADTHELDKVSTKNHLVLTFDGETMEVAEALDNGDVVVPANPSTYAGFDEEELGTSFNIWTDRNGFIVYSDYANETSNYMMVLDTSDGNGGVRRELGMMDILLADNSIDKDVEVASDLKIDGSSTKNGYDKDDRSFTESMVVGNVYKYWTDEDGVITKMESVVDLDDDDTKPGDDYTYVSKNDRLTVNGQSYALEDADVIFAVKENYITHTAGGDLYVDDANVLAVAQEDIPDIGEAGSDEDTISAVLDSDQTGYGSWVNDADTRVVLNADRNKDVSAIVLGVDSFNKFNAASTKVGLVTNVSYDKNDVVSVDVAYNGEVTTVSSVEDTDFDDVVSVKVYGDGDESVGSRTEKITKGLMAGSTLKDYLNNSAAYAEITTDDDGNLTGVLFMDQKKDKAGKAEENIVAGNYYQVSRKVIADVKEGSWMSTVNEDVYYTAEDTLATIDTKNFQTVASDLADDVTYYTIDGRPTIYGAEDADDVDAFYADKKLNILNTDEDDDTIFTNFDGNPDITAAEAADVQVSGIRNDSDSANDIYYVADVASKVDVDNEGDIVAVYMFEDEMAETISLDGTLTVTDENNQNADVYGDDVVATVDCDSESLREDSVQIGVYSDADCKNLVRDIVKATKATFEGLDADTYYVKATGENMAADKKNDREQIGEVVKVVLAKKELDAATITVDPKNNQQVVLSDVGVEGLTKENFTVQQNSTILTDDMYDLKYDKVNGTYNFLIHAGVAVTDDFEITIDHKNYTWKDASIWEGDEAEPEEVKVKLTASWDADAKTVTVNGTGIADLDSLEYWTLMDSTDKNEMDSLTGITRGTSNNNVVISGTFVNGGVYKLHLDATVDGVRYTGVCDVNTPAN